jgi:DNA replication and repair protein RecF
MGATIAAPMYLTRLELTNVRTFRRLEVALEPGVHVITGENAQGKTNLLESIALLATTRAVRSGTDLDLISWDAVADDPLPAARFEADVATASGQRRLEIAVIGASAAAGQLPARASRRFRVNGVARRASDLIGQLRVVMFSANDLEIISGPPATRRRYLDITISQLDPEYVRASQRYARVLEQRNSLLRRIQERRAKPAELEFWDDELVAAGAVILRRRADVVRELGRDAAARYQDLAPYPGEALEVCYAPRLPEEAAAHLREHDLEDHFRAAVEANRTDDVRRGATLLGPHRDELRLVIGTHPAAVAASRGQQRSIAVALRLAEVALSTGRTGDAPVLLLDDILSELDAGHRERVLSVAFGVDQVLITSPDEDRPAAAELPGATRYRLADGQLTPLA